MSKIRCQAVCYARPMQALELKVPPPIVALLIAAAMWAISLAGPPSGVSTPVRIVVAVAIALCGGGISFSGALAFRRARTTVNPMKPEAASSLVTSGVFRFTRNPMYLGLLVVLLAWSVFLSSAWSLVGPLAFVLYINRFQIAPEERILSSMFGTDYATYKAKVRKWL
jgi:protein-S-isoprenylcysteine O-methyltransferase Ste14